MLRNMFMAFLLISSIKKRFKKNCKPEGIILFWFFIFTVHISETIVERSKKEAGKEKNNALQTSGKEFNLTSNKQGFTI